MKSVYCEIERSEGCTKINLYSKEEYREELRRRERRAELRRRRTHVQETIGGFIGFAGFMLMFCAGGTSEAWMFAVLGITGLGLMVLGGWMAHAFNGQENKAEWLRRARERGRVR